MVAVSISLAPCGLSWCWELRDFDGAIIAEGTAETPLSARLDAIRAGLELILSKH
jgi:hypothetical protein